MPILLALPSPTKFSTALPRSGGQDADSPDERARLVQNVDGPGFGSPRQGPEQGPVRPVQLRATRLPTLQDRELVAQDQDPGSLPRLLAPDSRSHPVMLRGQEEHEPQAHDPVIITGGTPGEQLCWSEPWMRFSARTLTAAPNPVVDVQEVSQPCA